MSITHTIARMGDSPSIDAFDRLRVSNPETIFDSKQLNDNLPLIWDDQQVSGAGTTSVHNADEAATTIGVSALTAGKRVRQTFQRFNYQPGKSQENLFTFTMFGALAGITKEVALFDDDNGLFARNKGGVMSLIVRSHVTGTAVDTVAEQSAWNLDTMDGRGGSGINLDFSKSQILFIDFEWLGVGRVRFGFVIDGIIVYCHQFLNANNLVHVYMSTPNLPVRYSIENDGTGAADEFVHICTSIISEGGSTSTGVLRYASTDGTHVDANVADEVYAVVGIRLKDGYLGTTIKETAITMISETNDDFEWILIGNPTVAGTFTFVDEGNGGSVEIARGATANTVTGGVPTGGGWSKSSSVVSSGLDNSLHLGVAIDGTKDAIVLCVRPVSSNADIQGSMTYREQM